MLTLSLIADMNRRAMALGVPLSVQVDLTYRCNHRCVHCYVEHEKPGEISTARSLRIARSVGRGRRLLPCFQRRRSSDAHGFLAHSGTRRSLLFCVKIKTNAFMIREDQADRMRDLGVHSVQVSVYSHRPEVHDAITRVPGSLARTISGIRLLRARGMQVTITNVLMRQNLSDSQGVQELAREVAAHFTIDPTITPKMDGDRSILGLGIGGDHLRRVFRTPELVGNVEEMCAPPLPVDSGVLDGYPSRRAPSRNG